MNYLLIGLLCNAQKRNIGHGNVGLHITHPCPPHAPPPPAPPLPDGADHMQTYVAGKCILIARSQVLVSVPICRMCVCWRTLMPRVCTRVTSGAEHL